MQVSFVAPSLYLAGITHARVADAPVERIADRSVQPDGGRDGSRQTQAENSGNRRSGRNLAVRELSAAQQQELAELRQVDREVRAHEQAHLLAGRGVVTNGAEFNYVYGPDGRQYAISGEVGIDTSPERQPEENIDKGQRIQAAALAPLEPSAQDYHVANIGIELESRGRNDLAQAGPDNPVTTEPADSAEGAAARGQVRQLLSQAYAAMGAAAERPRISLFA